MNWLECDDLPDAPRYIPVERLQAEELERLIGWEMNLYLEWKTKGRDYACNKVQNME